MMVAKMGVTGQMPPMPNREDIGATCVVLRLPPRHASVREADCCRWTYLEAGITRVMNDLRQGIDMQMYMGVYTYASPQPALHFTNDRY